MELFSGAVEFEWDAGNREKNLRKHRVSDAECEEVFFDPHKRILKGGLHVGGKGRELRYVMIARTKMERALFIVFTLRGREVRIISARDLNRKERRWLS